MIDLRNVAHALGGEICGRQVLAPGPNPSPKDRSLSVKFSPHAPDGFIVHSHSGDDWRDCRDYVASRLGLQCARPSHRAGLSRQRDHSDANRNEFALAIWSEAKPIEGTLAQKYLTLRGILPSESLSHVIRFHPSCPFGQDRFPALISLIRDIKTDKPQAIQRTAITRMERPLSATAKRFA
jgi:putative DNA primase/helicase